MKRYASIFCFLVCLIAAQATIYVYSTKDAVQIQRNGQWANLFVGDTVQGTDWIQTGEFGKVDFYDDNINNFISIQSSTPQQVKQLIDQNNTKTSSLPQEYRRGIRDALRGRTEIINDLWNTRGGGVSRGSEDWDYQVCTALLNRKNGASDYSIKFSIIDYRTMQSVTKVAENQQIIIEVSNNSNTPLFVNIIDCMPNGDKEALVKVDSFDAIMDLHIPAHSIIRLTNYPISFFPANTTDTLQLIASPVPFNLSNVLNMMKKPEMLNRTKKSDYPIGVYTTTIQITGK